MTAQNMFSLSQTFPGREKRALRTSVAESGVDVAKANLDAVRLDVRVRVRKAFDDLLLVQDEMRIHDEHVGIAQQAIEAARIKYTVGKVPQQDMLKAQVALTGLAEHMIRFDHDAAVARARLNTLLGRDPGCAVSRFRASTPCWLRCPPSKGSKALLWMRGPIWWRLAPAAERSHKEQALAKKAYVPDFTVSAGYMLMPSGSDMRNDYMMEGSMNLPWLNHRKHNAEIAEATAQAHRAGRRTGGAAQRRVRADSGSAGGGRKRRSSWRIMYHDQLRPQAEATLQSSVIAYENNKTGFLDLLDSQMRVIDIDLAWLQAVADFDTRLADLEMATGAPLDQSAAAPHRR